MGFNFRQNKYVPQELPDLICDEIEGESQPQYPTQEQPAQRKSIEDYKIGKYEKDKIIQAVETEISSVKNPELEIHQPNLQPSQPAPQQSQPTPQPTPQPTHPKEKSFFEDFQNKLESEVSDTDSLENWCQSKFSSKDMLNEMKNYWENQKTSPLLEAFSQDFKKKISEQIKNLRNLEEDWRYTYFDLIKKEDKIKGAEEELKKTINEFVEICKHKKEILENEKNKTSQKEQDIQKEN